DGGETFTWLGTELGPDGGDDLMLSYDAQCSYFGDPFDCIPNESSVARQLDGTIRFTTDEATHESEVELSERSLSGVRLTGPDADQFAVRIVDVASGTSVDP